MHEHRVRRRHETRRSRQQRKRPVSKGTLVLVTRSAVLMASLRFGAMVGNVSPFICILKSLIRQDWKYVTRIYMTFQHRAHL